MIVKKKICILGSTGSIGTQTLDVISRFPDLFEINYLSTYNNIKLLEEQCKKFNPKGVVVCEVNAYNEFIAKTNFKGKIFKNDVGLIEITADTDNDLVVSALVGFSGVKPTLTAIENGINIALANKETLVSAGKIIIETAKKNNVKIFPIDSEHNAIFQCLQGEKIESIEKIILTASGGPFLHTPQEKMSNIKLEDALKHPTWSMGNKVTIDSATMMNKGFEAIEAYWLFGLKMKQIDILIHPQSIIHSMVQYKDGSIKAQLSVPDMRIPISFALTYPARLEYDFPRVDFTKLGQLDFFEPDFQKFPCLEIAYNAIDKGGNLPTIVNAANEVVVAAFCKNLIGFMDIHKYIIKAMIKIPYIPEPTLDDLIQTNVETRNFITNFFS